MYKFLLWFWGHDEAKITAGNKKKEEKTKCGRPSPFIIIVV